MFTWILTSVLLMLNLCLWIGNICNGLLLGNASIAKNSQDMRLQENHGLQNSPWGGGKPYLASGLLIIDFEYYVSNWYTGSMPGSSRLRLMLVSVSKKKKQF